MVKLMAKAKIGGKTSLEATKKSINSKKEINTKVKITDLEQQEDDNREYYCTACGSKYKVQKGNFSRTKSPLYRANNGYITTCNRCRDSYYNDIVKLYGGNEEQAIEHICRLYDWYFSDIAVASSKTTSVSRIADYVNKMNMAQVARKGSTYIDTVKENFLKEQEDTIETYDDVKDGTKVKLKTIKFFGADAGLTDTDYIYLQDQYDDWCARVEVTGKASEEIIKQICFVQLDILKARKKGESTKDLTKTLQDLMDSANLKPKQNGASALSDTQTFGTMIEKWEQEEPIPEIDPELKDVDKIGWYIDVFFKGHLIKACNIKNIKSTALDLYNKFIKKYTVEKPQYDSDEGEEDLFNLLFGQEKNAEEYDSSGEEDE